MSLSFKHVPEWIRLRKPTPVGVLFWACTKGHWGLISIHDKPLPDQKLLLLVLGLEHKTTGCDCEEGACHWAITNRRSVSIPVREKLIKAAQFK